MTQRDKSLIPHRLKAKGKDRIRKCLHRTTVDLYLIRMATETKKLKSGIEVPTDTAPIRNIEKNMREGNFKEAARGMNDVQGILESIERNLDKPKRKRKKPRK